MSISLYDITMFVGCFFGQFILVGAIYIGTRTKHDSYIRAYTINGLAMVLSLLLSGIGKGSLAAPDYEDAPYRVAAAILLCVLDLIVVRSKEAN